MLHAAMFHVAMLHVAWRVLHVAGRVLSAAWAGHGYACCTLHVVLYAARCMSHDACCASRFVAFVPFRRHGHRSNGRLTAEVPRACQRLAHIAHRHVRPLPNGGRDDRMLSVPPIPYMHAGTLFASLRPLVRIARPGATRDDPMPSVPLPWAPTSRFI